MAIKRYCLDIFYSLYNSVVEFLQEIDEKLCNDVKKISNDAAYLSDILENLILLTLSFRAME